MTLNHPGKGSVTAVLVIDRQIVHYSQKKAILYKIDEGLKQIRFN
jgi:hypothetical protein